MKLMKVRNVQSKRAENFLLKVESFRASSFTYIVFLDPYNVRVSNASTLDFVTLQIRIREQEEHFPVVTRGVISAIRKVRLSTI